MTQQEMANQLGIRREYLNAILRKKMIPGVKLAERICKMTGRDFFDLRPDLKELLKKHL